MEDPLAGAVCERPGETGSGTRPGVNSDLLDITDQCARRTTEPTVGVDLELDLAVTGQHVELGGGFGSVGVDIEVYDIMLTSRLVDVLAGLLGVGLDLDVSGLVLGGVLDLLLGLGFIDLQLDDDALEPLFDLFLPPLRSIFDMPVGLEQRIPNAV